MIVSEDELAHIRGKAKALWLPVTYGTYYEEGRTQPVRRPHACPLKPESKRSLQLRPFTPTVCTITITEATITPLLSADPRPAGYKFLAQARAAYEAKHGATPDDAHIWVVKFEVGDLTPLYEGLRERYLKRKMGGARDYTTNPALAIKGEGAVPTADEMKYAATAAERRDLDARRQLQQTLRVIRASIAELAPSQGSLDEQTKKDLRWMRRRAGMIEKRQRARAPTNEGSRGVLYPG